MPGGMIFCECMCAFDSVGFTQYTGVAPVRQDEIRIFHVWTDGDPQEETTFCYSIFITFGLSYF